MSQTKLPRVTKKLIEEHQELEARRKALSREASDLRKQQDAIEEALVALVREEGGKARSVKKCGYVLAMHDASGSVGWKQEFVKVAGIDAAEELIAAAPKREVLSVEKAA